MLGLGVLAPQADFTWIDPDYGELASQAGQFVPSLIGAGLVVMAIGLSHRVNLAWGLTICFWWSAPPLPPRRKTGCGWSAYWCSRRFCWRRSGPVSIAMPI